MTKVAAIDAALKGRFQGLAARPAPEHILRIVDMLEEANAVPVPSPSGEVSAKPTEGASAQNARAARR